jgi:hypothetical protein
VISNKTQLPSNEQAAVKGRLFCFHNADFSDRDCRAARKPSAQNAKMKSFDKIQQFGAHTGGHERAAVIAGGFRKPVVLAAKAASKDTKIRGLFLSTGGSCHSIFSGS